MALVTICDPACGTGGMLAESQNWIRAHNEHATVKVYGQDYNPRSYAVAASDLPIKGHRDSRIEYGNTLTNDQFPDMRFDYLLANPPFGVDWKGEKKELDRWPNFRGYNGKLPRVNDGALLFLITQQAKERYLDTCPELLDAVLAVEEALGGEPHYDWNHVWEKVQKIVKALPDDVESWVKGTKGTAQKKLFRDVFTEVDPEAEPVIAKHHKVDDLGTATLFPGQTLPANLKPGELEALLGLYADGKGKHIEYEPEPALKDFENIPLKEDIISYFLREVQPYVNDAWIDRETLDEQDGGIGRVGYEINFNREFFRYQPPRPLAKIDAELETVERRIMELLREVTE